MEESRQVLLVSFDAQRRYAVVSYGETKAECQAVRPLCDAIADALADGGLPSPRAANWGKVRQSAPETEAPR